MSKAKTGVEEIDSSIRAAYSKSLCLFLPPLVANKMLNLDDVNKIVASLGKKMEGINKQTQHKVYISLREGGANGTPAQVMAAGAKLAATLKQLMKQDPKKGQYQAECNADELVTKYSKAGAPQDPNYLEEVRWLEQQNDLKIEQDLRERYKITRDDLNFACNLTTGRLSSRYHSVSYCTAHKCEITKDHIETCHLFSTNNGNTHPKDWMFAIRDE
jgi:hypothetical protein